MAVIALTMVRVWCKEKKREFYLQESRKNQLRNNIRKGIFPKQMEHILEHALSGSRKR